MSGGAFRSTGATSEVGSGQRDTILDVITDGPHVRIQRVGRLSPPRPRPKTRNTCGRKIGELDGPDVCARCRASTSKLAINVMRRHGRDAWARVDGEEWPIWVLAAIGPPFLRTLAHIQPPAADEPMITWTTMRVQDSPTTHIGITRIRVTDATSWVQAQDPFPIQTVCLRPGVEDTAMDRHPDASCGACLTARDRVMGATSQIHPQPSPAEPRAAAVTPSPGDDARPLLADRERLVTVAEVQTVGDGHASLRWMLRLDATMDRVERLERIVALVPGRPTLCGAEREDTPTTRTPSGGCRRCAGGANRVGLLASRHWPGGRTAVLVDGTHVPADVLGGARNQLADPALMGHLSPVAVDSAAVNSAAAGESPVGDAVALPGGPGNRIDVCAIAPSAVVGGGALHLGWVQRVEQTSWGHPWTALLPQPWATLCGQRAAGLPAADCSTWATCEVCARAALRPRARMGRHAPAEGATVTIIGSTIDDAVVELMGEPFAVAMVCDDMRERALQASA